MRITLKQLVVFDAVARLGFVNQAAEEISLSQSATSMALRDLEKNLDVSLFHRHKKKLTLNENGRRLQPLVRSLLIQARDIESNVSTLQGKLTIGASSTIGQFLIPGICAKFVTKNPDVRIHLVVSKTAQLIEDVDKLILDIGFIEAPCNRQSLHMIPVGGDRLSLVVGKGHRLAAKKRVKIRDLAGERWILLDVPSATRTLLTIGIRNQVGALDIALETNNIEVIKEAVKCGMGISCLSTLAVKDELKSGELVCLALEGLSLERRFNAIYRSDVYHGSVQKEFINYVKANLPSGVISD